MNKKQLLEHALEYGYKVRVVCQTATYDGFVVKCRDSDGISGFNMSNMTSYVYKNYNAVISVEPLEAEVEKAENVYEFIRRELEETSIGALSVSSVMHIVDEAQRRFGGIDSVSEGDSGKSSILDEHSVWSRRDNPRYGVDIIDEEDETLATSYTMEMTKYLLALQDAYRALKDAKDIIGRETTCHYDLHQRICDALKKAGVE